MSELPSLPHEEHCSFCRRPRSVVVALVTASRTSICDTCVDAYRDQRPLFQQFKIAFFGYPETPINFKPTTAYRGPSPSACDFCGGEHNTIYTRNSTRICDPCLELSFQVIATTRPQ